MAKDFVRLTHALFLPAGEACHEGLWRPAADVYRTRRGWLVKFDLAGVRPQDIELTVKGSRMTVRGVRRDFLLEEGYSHYRMEIAYSRFERCLELPCDLAMADLTTEYRDGMLLIHIPVEACG